MSAPDALQVLRISDGTRGHDNQSLALVEALTREWDDKLAGELQFNGSVRPDDLLELFLCDDLARPSEQSGQDLKRLLL